MNTVSCQHCKTEVRVDLSRLAPGQGARITCPACRQPFVVQAPGGAEPPPAAEPAARERPAMTADDRAWLRRELEALRPEMERRVLAQVLETMGVRQGKDEEDEGDPDEVKAALVCDTDPAFAQAMADGLKELGYAPTIVSDLATAWRTLDRELQVVCVTEALTDDPGAGTKILDRLSRMPGAKRRRIFVAHVSAEIRSQDGGLAFVLGANMTINRSDIGRVRELLRKGLLDRDRTYRQFLRAHEAVEHGIPSR